MKKAWFLILTAVFTMIVGLSMAATPAPIPTPYVDVQISFSDGSSAVTTSTPYAAFAIQDGASTKWWMH